MSEVLVGKAYGLVELRYQQLTQGVTAVEQQFNRLRALTAKPIIAQIGAAGGGAAAGRAPSVAVPAQLDAAQTRAALSAQRLATEQQRTAIAAQRLSTEERRTAAATAQADAAQSRAAASALRLDQAQQRASGGGRSLGSAIGGIQTALGAAGIALGAQQLIQFGLESGRAALALDHTLRVTREVSGNTRVYGEVIAAARQQQLLFGGTLQENIAGLSGLTITARQSGANLQQLIDLSQRLTVLSPEQGIGGARIALAEALSGNISSLSKRFEVPKSALKGLSDESKTVAERLAVLDRFLTSVGVSSRTVTGTVSETAQTYNALSAALDNAKTSFGAFAAEALSDAARGATRILTGDFKAMREAIDSAGHEGMVRLVVLTGGLGGLLPPLLRYAEGTQQATAETQRLVEQAERVGGAMDDERRATLQTTDAIRESAFALSEEAREKINDQIATAALNEEQRNLERDSALAAQGLLGAGDQAVILGQKYGFAASQAQFLINQQQALTNAEGLADQRAGERSGGAVKSAKELQVQSDLARQKAARDREEAARVSQAQTALELQRAKTAQQRIAILQREQAATTNQAKKLRLQAQIEAERNSGATRHTKELNTQLGLNERIRDSLESQYKARLDAAELAIRDRQERRKEDQEIRAAQRILASGRASQQFKDAAADRLALIAIEREQRAQAIREKQATAGGTLINGRVFQSQPTVSGGGIPSGAPGVAAPGVAGGPGAAAAPGGAGGNLVIQFVVDGQVIANAIIPSVLGAGRASLARVEAGGGGQNA